VKVPYGRESFLEPLVSCKVANREVRAEDYLRLNKEQIPITKLGTDPSTKAQGKLNRNRIGGIMAAESFTVLHLASLEETR
jgi:hypothetical protein